jgi:chorismate mutase
MDKKYILVDKTVLPEVFEKVLQAKELLKADENLGISKVVAMVGISRSTYYKYHDRVFPLIQETVERKATISLLLSHKTGALSSLLRLIAESNGNVLTISQETPVNKAANVTIAFDISKLNKPLDALLDQLKAVDGVSKFKLIGVE